MTLKHIHIIQILLIGIVLFVAGPAFADENEIFKKSCSKLNAIQEFVFGAAYVIGAIGLVVIAVSAFLGRFKFAHLIALGGGLFIVAMADLLLSFITGDKGGLDSCASS
ncbi:TrbC/VirB2 family protein [Pseudooceanicola aestuarii]|uniref:TrbC/VirB2 family protein n=1 Tax=Pseudooceanicola aestuarii TaxID=2697319 RepID=UPI0013D809E7|nr:TrbC/VirB2 family protein [Pseudooceanicola aestuarii]